MYYNCCDVDLAKGVFDEKCTMTYLCMLKQALPPLPEGNSWSEKDQLQQRYDEVSRWVEEKRILLSRREQPTNLENCKVIELFPLCSRCIYLCVCCVERDKHCQQNYKGLQIERKRSY